MLVHFKSITIFCPEQMFISDWEDSWWCVYVTIVAVWLVKANASLIYESKEKENSQQNATISLEKK